RSYSFLLDSIMFSVFFFFFFQAEDGIRDSSVTGVQTCALPISSYAGVQLIFFASKEPLNTARFWQEPEDEVAYTVFSALRGIPKIGRASCRERVEIAVGGVSVKNKKPIVTQYAEDRVMAIDRVQ